jgi:hypothetical protein
MARVTRAQTIPRFVSSYEKYRYLLSNHRLFSPLMGYNCSRKIMARGSETMQPLLPLMCAIILFVTLSMSRVDTSYAQQRFRDDPACTVIGEHFFQQTSLREKGASIKDVLEVTAKTSQQHPEAGNEQAHCRRSLQPCEF